MNLRKSALAPSRQLVDAVMDGYVTWREQSAAVRAAYKTWTRAGATEREPAFEAYLIALDREESAAAEYRRLVEQVQRR